MYRIIGADQKEYGPVNADQIRQWIATSRATGSTKVQPEGSTEWKLLSELPEFAEALSAAHPLPSLPSQATPGGPPQTSGMAIASLICGIVGLFVCITAPVGLVLGFIARSQIKKSQGQLKGSGLAMAGIIIS